LGYIAYQRLEARGPELLNLLLRGSTPQAKAAIKTSPSDEAWNVLPLKKKLVVWVCASLFWLPLFPQGIVPLVFKLAGIDARSWFLALYLPCPVSMACNCGYDRVRGSYARSGYPDSSQTSTAAA
jgi:ABC-2 type transport system permease protein